MDDPNTPEVHISRADVAEAARIRCELCLRRQLPPSCCCAGGSAAARGAVPSNGSSLGGPGRLSPPAVLDVQPAGFFLG
jgi:hypothetical protein